MDISENELFLAPRPRRLRKTGGPGTQREFALQIFRSSFTARGARKFDFFLKILPNALSTFQEMFPNLSKTQTFAGGTNWREIRSVQEPERASDLKMLTVSDHPR